MSLPRYVERDFARYLECGGLSHGFARVRGEGRKVELLVAFSCKGRGLCPSCTAKRAQVTATCRSPFMRVNKDHPAYQH
ncbi:transposase zinc-binding domain-containing protein [Stigmatella erecta]|uniref:Transposase zinc-binding domain-containing protein n=1 Tax=Stigmatella erecta TaxID=83460 RepID=A0A1I0LIA5_9BACT|nr:Transposase zinc-binding domain-containing protein [Stigmatella erecta]